MRIRTCLGHELLLLIIYVDRSIVVLFFFFWVLAVLVTRQSFGKAIADDHEDVEAVRSHPVAISKIPPIVGKSYRDPLI